eukprot:9324939-Pyramimonas_sp.AAC.1
MSEEARQKVLYCARAPNFLRESRGLGGGGREGRPRSEQARQSAARARKRSTEGPARQPQSDQRAPSLDFSARASHSTSRGGPHDEHLSRLSRCVPGRPSGAQHWRNVPSQRRARVQPVARPSQPAGRRRQDPAADAGRRG